jgi:hypothetical protein
MPTKFIFTATIIILSTLNFSVAQTKKGSQNTRSKTRKILFSPTDKSFSIAVPVRLKEDKDAYKEEKSMKSIRVFGGFTSKMVFLVYEITFKDGDINIKEPTKKKVGGMEFLIGGDDDHDFAEAFMEIDGFQAREVVYRKQNAKGIMIDAGNRVYVLCLASKNRKNLQSVVANRFLNSFHLIRKSEK